METSEGTQDGNGDGSGDRAGTGTGTGVETRGRTQHENGDGSGDKNKSSVVEMGTGTMMRTGTGTRTGSRRVEERWRSARNHTRVVDAMRKFHSARAIISADKGWRLRAPDSFLRKARCPYTRIAPRG